MSKRSTARNLKWTPPIFGWQYEIIWDGDGESCFTWDHNHWLPDYPYRVWVTGRSYSPGRIQWSVYLMLVGLDHVRIVAHSERGLDHAVRALERQVIGMLKGIEQLHVDWGKRPKV